MKEFLIQNKPENKSESEKKYIALVEGYLLGAKKFDALIEEIEKTIRTSVTDEKNIMSKISEPVIFISNHPRLDLSLSIPADKIQNVKGGNAFGFDRFNYPIIRQLMLRKLLKRPFSTVSFDNGWREAMEECWHIIVTRGGNNRFNEIMEQYTPGSSIVIYPEGKSTGKAEMHPFRSGFFHVARALNFYKIVLGVSSPMISVDGNNSMSIIESIDMPSSDADSQKFIESSREKILSELKKIHK
jgi:hypothetical protein